MIKVMRNRDKRLRINIKKNEEAEKRDEEEKEEREEEEKKENDPLIIINTNKLQDIVVVSFGDRSI